MSDGNSLTLLEVPDLHLSEEECDIRIILHCLYESCNLSEEGIITVISPDTDVVLLLYP